MSEKLKLVIDVLSDAELDSEDAVVGKLIQLGFDKIVAEKYAAIIPLAFARIFLEKQGIICTNYVMLQNKKGKWVQRNLSSDNIFIEAKSFAEKNIANECCTNIILSIAKGSWDMRIVSERLLAHDNVMGATLSDTMLIRITLEEWDKMSMKNKRLFQLFR